MFKRFLAMLLCLVLTVSLTGCNLEFKIPEDLFSSSNPRDAVTFFENILGGTPFGSSSNFEVVSPSVDLPDAPKTNHTPISRENYYQYSLLNDTEKQIYNDICEGIEKQQNYINVGKYKLNDQQLERLFNIVTADNPQYFWLTKFFQYAYYDVNGETEITHIILCYTDGTITDEFDDNNKFITTANRETIKSQKIAFDKNVTDFLNTVPHTLPKIEKERLIHDFVLKKIVYAKSELEKPLERNNYLRIYDLYGAMVNGFAVCEGYAELFQYLCYQTGINATQVIGESEGESHAWNTVNIEGEWYHIDTTWDDGSSNGIPLYTYYNLTTAQISKDHIIDASVFAVPKASSEKHSFKNTYGIVVNRYSKPKNYEAAIDYSIKYNSKYLILVCDGQKPTRNYLNRFFVELNSDVQKYAKINNYSLKFKTTYYEVENLIYLEIK